MGIRLKLGFLRPKLGERTGVSVKNSDINWGWQLGADLMKKIYVEEADSASSIVLLKLIIKGRVSDLNGTVNYRVGERN